ncbi:MAG: 30S ribosomal protein S5 [Candidatus Zambryskibacteria bacterium]|nr:30S ribosomal protein S5 [Candidatus Zambryskibacteria bacterium]
MDPEEIKIEEIEPIEPIILPKELVSTQAPREFKKNSRRSSPRREARVKPEFDQKIISIRRVTRVVTGGRRFSFSVGIVIGDKRGRVGVGLGKAGDTPIAINKAIRDARKNMIKVNMTKSGSIPHEVSAKYSSSRIIIMRAPGKGILAGSSVRIVLEYAGVKEVSAKIFSRSKNKINNAKAAIKALNQLVLRK